MIEYLGETKNGVTAPKRKGKAARTWFIFDKMSKGGIVSRFHFIERCKADGLKESTSSYHFSKWVKFHNKAVIRKNAMKKQKAKSTVYSPVQPLSQTDLVNDNFLKHAIESGSLEPKVKTIEYYE